MPISDLTTDLDTRARDALKQPVELIASDSIPTEDDMFFEVPKWIDVKDAVVLAADLKGSTKLNVSKYGQTSARIYEAVTSNMVRAVNHYDPAYMDIQGDGVFAIFDGDKPSHRALCAGVTLLTWSRDLASRIAASYPRVPATGIKVGLDRRRVLVKKVGIRGKREPVWAGKPVNYATKAAQFADAHQLVATERVFNTFEGNEWVNYSCGCGPSGVPQPLWDAVAVDKLPDTAVNCHRLESFWCSTHGDETHDAILAGKTSRDDVTALVSI